VRVAAEPSNVIEVRDLVKRYGSRVAVDHLNLDIRRGEFLSLLGPNGAGKSTTLRVLTTLLPPTEGSVVVAGHRLPQEKDRVKPLLGLVPQEIALYDTLSARHNLRFFARLYGLRGKHLEGRVQRLLADVGLADRADQPVRTFSGGMQRRVNIAAALVHDPEIVFLDEPTVGLDPVSRDAIWKILEELRARGKTLVLTTHYMEEAEALSDRVAIVDHGKVIAHGTPAELIRATGVQTVLNLTVAGAPEAALGPARALPDVQDAAVADGRVRVTTASGSRLLPPLLQALLNAGVEVLAVEVVAPNLGAVFLHFTGRELRDEAERRQELEALSRTLRRSSSGSMAVKPPAQPASDGRGP
jgi:ABC-2 type transport system ATP-binding protein